MSQGGVGRVLTASLHQGIADMMPTRLEFYENWLDPVRLRKGTIGLGPLAAVLSFLREEGEPYGRVTQRAGEYAAQWTYEDLPAVRRSLIRALPVMWRARLALQITQRVVRLSYQGSRAMTRLRHGQGTFTVVGSIFCNVREPWEYPLCDYYAAALSRLLTLVDVDGDARVDACSGMSGPACVVSVVIRDGKGTPPLAPAGMGPGEP